MKGERLFVPVSLVLSAVEVALASHYRAHVWFAVVSLFLAAANAREALRIAIRWLEEDARDRVS